MTGIQFPTRPIGLLCLASLLTPLAAQESPVGFRSGLMVGGVSGARYATFRPGLTLGPTISMHVTNWLAVQTEVLYQSWGFGWTDPVPASASVRQVSVPMLARVDIGGRTTGPVHLMLLAGAYSSYMLRCHISGAHDCSAGNEVAPFTFVHQFDIGPVVGAGLSADLFHAIRLGTEVRYQRGFRNMGSPGSDLRGRAWSFVFRLSGLGGGGSDQMFLDGPRPLTNERAPHLPDGRRIGPGGGH